MSSFSDYVYAKSYFPCLRCFLWRGGGLAPSMDSFSSPLFTYIANRLTNDNLDKTSLVDGLACASDWQKHKKSAKTLGMKNYGGLRETRLEVCVTS